MRIAFIGASRITVSTAKKLIKRRHDVVIVEKDRERLEQLQDELDCGFILGDGSRVHILREVGPKDTDVLLCLTTDDQDNILAALVGRSLGFKRVIPKIVDPELQNICNELDLSDTIVPDETISRDLFDMVEGRSELDLSSMVTGDVRLFTFVAGEAEEGKPVGDLDLPKETRAICIYREDGFLLPEADTKIGRGDRLLLITQAASLETLRKTWPS